MPLQGCATSGRCSGLQNLVYSCFYSPLWAVTAAQEMVWELAGCWGVGRARLPSLPVIHRLHAPKFPAGKCHQQRVALPWDPSVSGRAEADWHSPHSSLWHTEMATQPAEGRPSPGALLPHRLTAVLQDAKGTLQARDCCDCWSAEGNRRERVSTWENRGLGTLKCPPELTKSWLKLVFALQRHHLLIDPGANTGVEARYRGRFLFLPHTSKLFKTLGNLVPCIDRWK